jgi:beta-barrel assembly-enhancing protease
MDKTTALIELEAALKELNSTSIGRRAFLMATPLLLASCASGPQTRTREGDNTGQDTDITVADEQRMAREALSEMRKDYPVHEDPELQKYVAGVGNRMIAANGLNANPYQYTFTVVDVPTVNAFALPAGTIFVTAPLLAMAETEAELAGVLGHEVGHVKARHTAERIDAAQKSSKRNILYALGGSVLGGAAGYGLGKLLCRPEDKKCLQTATIAGAAGGAGAGLLIQKYKYMANSREDEMEADRIGFRTSVRAGYDKDHVGTFYAKLLKMEESRNKGGSPMLASFADAMSTHPPSRERVTQMEELALHQRNSGSVVTTPTFERIRKRAQRYIKA